MNSEITRRMAIGVLAGGASLLPRVAQSAPIQARIIPSTGERIPSIGMGSWRTFDVGGDAAAVAARTEVLRAFFSNGGRLIDSSPMYGSSQRVIGAALNRLGRPASLIAADKVWTSGQAEGQAQITQSLSHWGVPLFDVLQVHNMVDWRTQLKTLFALKDVKHLRYAGVTSYDGVRYDELESIMKSEPIDFVQFSYNIADRRAEARLLPLARDRGIAVIINRPFQEGRLFAAVAGRKLPSLARDIAASNWAQYLLKYIISHPAVTTAIPATRSADHMRQNMLALRGPMPDQALRQKMSEAFAA